MSMKSIVVAAALLSLVAGAADAQNKANPPQNPTAAPQGSEQGMMGNAPTKGQDGGSGMMSSAAPEQEATKERGIVGIFLDLSVDAVGAPARLIVRGVAPYSPAYYAGITGGDQIVAVDGQPVEAKGLSDVAKAIRGEAGTPVKLSMSRQGQSREVSLTRVQPVSNHHGHHMSGDSHMQGGGMMGMHEGMMGDRHENGSGDDGQNDMMGMMDTNGDMIGDRHQNGWAEGSDGQHGIGGGSGTMMGGSGSMMGGEMMNHEDRTDKNMMGMMRMMMRMHRMMKMMDAMDAVDGIGAMEDADAMGGMGNMSNMLDACTKMMESRAQPPNQPQQLQQAPKNE